MEHTFLSEEAEQPKNLFIGWRISTYRWQLRYGTFLRKELTSNFQTKNWRN